MILWTIGVILAIFEKLHIISQVDSEQGTVASSGTVSAGYQNFLICIEMFFAALALRYAFPHQTYSQGCEGGTGRSVTMQSISSSLKETMNPKDIYNDAIHNFHPQYQQYTQYQAAAPQSKTSSSSSQQRDDGQRASGSAPSSSQPTTSAGVTGSSQHTQDGRSTTARSASGQVTRTVDSSSSSGAKPVTSSSSSTTGATGGNVSSKPLSTISQKYSEKTTLLSSDDEFQ